MFWSATFLRLLFILTIPLYQKCFYFMMSHQIRNVDVSRLFFHSQPLLSLLANINNSWPTCVTDRLQASPFNYHHYHHYSQRMLFTILQFATHATEVWFWSVVQFVYNAVLPLQQTIVISISSPSHFKTNCIVSLLQCIYKTLPMMPFVMRVWCWMTYNVLCHRELLWKCYAFMVTYFFKGTVAASLMLCKHGDLMLSPFCV